MYVKSFISPSRVDHVRRRRTDQGLAGYTAEPTWSTAEYGRWRTVEGRTCRLYVCRPCESAQATGKILAKQCGWKSRTIDCFRNVNHGLWQGKLVDEVRRLQPRVYKQFQENPVGICPPEGEMLDSALARVESMLDKLVRRHRNGSICMVIPEPLASVVRCHLLGCDFSDVWTHQLDAGTWELLTLHQPMTVSV